MAHAEQPVEQGIETGEHPGLSVKLRASDPPITDLQAELRSMHERALRVQKRVSVGDAYPMRPGSIVQ